jgi:phage shock protein A
MLEKMREKVETQEARAEAYGEMANASKSVDDEINKALNNSKGSAALDDLMAQMGMAPVTPPAKVLDIEIQQPVVLENEPKVDNANNTNTNTI